MALLQKLPPDLDAALNERFGDGVNKGALPIWILRGNLGGVGTLNQTIGAPGAAGLRARDLLPIAAAVLAVWFILRLIR